MANALEVFVGNNTFRVTDVELYPAAAVGEWRGLLAMAQEQLGGVSTGIGFIGSPEWAIGGALALGFVERAVSSAKAKEGVRTLEQASEVMKTVRQAGKTFF